MRNHECATRRSGWSGRRGTAALATLLCAAALGAPAAAVTATATAAGTGTVAATAAGAALTAGSTEGARAGRSGAPAAHGAKGHPRLASFIVSGD
ncbi:hypothetical protein GCM10009665_34440 [Kitasatospora nipponensis]|uniref:Uncharacterized protein n=1 Tax=Kitasatospora nipponensis TaxID=258049 RepID=A0ABN1W8P1_9ACTN